MKAQFTLGAAPHRLLPFFTGSVLTGYVARRPFWALRFLLVASLGHGALDGFGLIVWRGGVDLSAALVAPLLLWLASGCWLAAFGRWTWHYAPLLWQPRRDGRPG